MKTKNLEGMNNIVESDISTPTYHSNANMIKEPTEQDAIYDFGGANVKSCASIALSKSISKGLIPSGTVLPQQWKTSPNMHQNFTSLSSMDLNPFQNTKRKQYS